MENAITDWRDLAAPQSIDDAQALAEAFRAWWVAENGEDTTDECPYIAIALREQYGDAAEVWAGSYDCNPDQYHIVCAVNGYIIDISAEQFDGPEVAVCETADRDYAYMAFRLSPSAI